MRPKTVVRTILQPIAIAIVLAVGVRAAVQIYAIPSPSMAPTLQAGDQIVVTPYFRARPERGDVIVFRSPLGQNELIVKRVIGMPGDLVDSRLGRVRVGGHTLAEPYVLRQAATGAIPAQVVPPDCYFVLGDNRDASHDSRSWGVLPAQHVVGRARLVLWSSPGSAREEVLAATGTIAPSPAPRRTRHVFKWID